MKLTFPVFWLIEYQPDSSSLKYGHPNRGLLAVYWQNVRFSIIISTRIFDINVVPEHLSSAKWFIILDPAKDPNYEPVSLRIPSGTWRFSYLNEMSLYAIKWEREPDSSLSKAKGTSLSVIKGGDFLCHQWRMEPYETTKRRDIQNAIWYLIQLAS